MKPALIVIVVVGVFAILRVSQSPRSSGSSGGFCSMHTCVGNFGNGSGYIVQCADGTWSHSGDIQGVCSDHGGER